MVIFLSYVNVYLKGYMWETSEVLKKTHFLQLPNIRPAKYPSTLFTKIRMVSQLVSVSDSFCSYGPSFTSDKSLSHPMYLGKGHHISLTRILRPATEDDSPYKNHGSQGSGEQWGRSW